ncbi:hypothetical protein [Actinoplanes friuliensis]|uniref:Uncharacterized protein n=1 Tax=Actinoplanes friuliensis DSM 7358 TaxID=1246995 RepID=U5W9Y1_9ACTN|nr:hypothetical protein [Actinoplanes friuliensis]AGZ45827.1 hypothetical protein AFR_37865 [Actinoplanes friuliensis DSM 7358]
MRLPTFSRQSDTTETEERPAVATSSTTPVRQRTDPPTATMPTVTPPPAAPPTVVERRRSADEDTTADLKSPDLRAPERRPADRNADEKTIEQPPVTGSPADRTAARPAEPPVVAGPKPRASLLATLGLIVSVAAALLVLSGPLLGYGIGLGVLGLILSLGGISATGKRHIAGKTDALIGMILSLGAIVVGVLALTGSLSWLGTDMQPVTSVREWLDAQFVNRF